VVHWPKGIQAKGQVRSQFHHVVDVAPTILEATKLPEPTEVNGTPQVPMEGVSMLYSFEDASAKDRHTTQYFEMFGNRALYHEGWLAGTIHRAPWEMTPRRPLQDDVWELYDTRKDFSLAHDLAKEQPEKLAELQALFMQEAEKHHVLPIDDRTAERVNAETAGRPELMGKRTKITLAEGMVGFSENAFLNTKNKSVTITAKVVVPQRGHGIIVAQAGRFGGWALYMDKGRPAYHYNFLGLEQFDVKAKQPIAAGEATIRMEFAYDGGGPGKGGVTTIFVNDAKVAEGRIERTQFGIFSADETADVGIDLATPVGEAIGSGEKSRFTGTIPEVTLEVHAAK